MAEEHEHIISLSEVKLFLFRLFVIREVDEMKQRLQ